MQVMLFQVGTLDGLPLLAPVPTMYLASEIKIQLINPAKMAAVKNILQDATDDYLGLMARSLKECISRCDNQAEHQTH